MAWKFKGDWSFKYIELKVSHILIRIKIEKNIFKIEIESKINEMTNNEIVDMFCIVLSFKIEEKRKGNEYDKAWLKLKYIKNLMITENINIFNLVRLPNLYEFASYIKKIEKNFDLQNIETKISLNDYFTQTENISQEIIIAMVFEIESKVEEIIDKKKKLFRNLELTESNNEVFEIIKKEG